MCKPAAYQTQHKEKDRGIPMGKFLLFCGTVAAIGLTAWACLQHPADVKDGMTRGVAAASSAVVAGVQKGAAGATSAINTPPAPPSTAKADSK